MEGTGGEQHTENPAAIISGDKDIDENPNNDQLDFEMIAQSSQNLIREANFEQSNGASREKTKPPERPTGNEPQGKKPRIDQQEDKLNNTAKLYQRNNPGPYSVHVQSKNKNIGKVHITSIGKRLSQAKTPGIKYIAPLGKNKIEVIFETAKDANNFINSKVGENNEWDCYIPSHKVQTQGIIKGIDTEISEEDIKNDIQVYPQTTIKAVKRLLKKDKEDKNKLIPTTAIKITFEGTTLPEYAYIYHVKKSIELYIGDVIQCYNCFLFGHMSKHCNSKQTCCNCAEEGHTSADCKSPKPKCRNCKGEHLAVSRECPKRSEQYNLKKQALIEGITIKEARKKEKKQAAISNNNHLTYAKQFPELQPSTSAQSPKGAQQTNKVNRELLFSRAHLGKPRETHIRKSPRKNAQSRSDLPPQDLYYDSDISSTPSRNGVAYARTAREANPDENTDEKETDWLKILLIQIWEEIKDKMLKLLKNQLPLIIHTILSNDYLGQWIQGLQH